MVYCAAFEMRLGRNPFRGSNPLPSADSIRGFERRTEGFSVEKPREARSRKRFYSTERKTT